MSLGSFINDITGASSSARHQFQNQMALQHDAQNFAKWQMKNAHQIETADLQAAGLNPVLSAGASGGASAGVTEGSASAGTASGNPLDMLNTALSIKNTMAQADKTEAETRNIDADTETKKQTIEWTPALNKALIDYQNATTAKTKQEKMESMARTAAIQFQNKMAEMDVEKRTKNFSKELDIAKQQYELKLMELGVDKSTAGQAAKAFGKWVNAISPFTEFTGKSTSETPTYNITHNHF